MAPDVIDLISSSPSPPKQQEPPPSHCPPAPVRNDGGQSKRPTLSQSNGSDPIPLWLLEGFDTTDDNVFGIDTRSTKRLRLSVSPPTSGTCKPRRAAVPATGPPQPPLRNITSERTSRLAFDPIELTSSIETEVPRSQHHSKPETSAAASRPTQPAKTSAQLFLSSDPFASSPPPQAAACHLAKLAQKASVEGFSDPFASSPPPPHPCPSKAPDTKFANQGLSDPFASSPQPTVAQTAEALPEPRAVSLGVTGHRNSRRRNDWDSISSSAPEQFSPIRLLPKALAAGTRSTEPTVISIDSDSQDESDHDEFPDIARFDLSKCKPRARSPLRRSRSEIVTSKSRLSASSATTNKKAAEQRAQATTKAAEKEKKRQNREQAKEAKAREKERASALAEVNKIRTDKKVSTPEMIVLMPSSLDPGLKMQVGILLDELSVEHSSWESPAGNTFRWRRKVTSRFDEEMGRWEPMPLQIKAEHHALILLTADELVGLAINGRLDSNVDQMKRHLPDHKIIYILEGVTPWMRKNRNFRNRQFASCVRSQGVSDTSSRGRRRNNAASEEHISEDLIEDAMMRLQVEHDVLIHHTAAPMETALWIVAFTQHISTIPYKKQRDRATAAAGFCMESGQVRTGDDARDTYVRMLQEIARVTAPIAYGIAAEFDSVTKLVDGLESRGPSTLEGVRKSANKDGALSDRTVGQAVGKRIFKVFTGKDEMSTDV